MKRRHWLDWSERLRPLPPLFRAGLLAIASLVVISAILMAAIPYLLARESIKDGVRAELSQMTGLPVAINGAITVSVFPEFIAKLDRVEVGTPDIRAGASMRAASLEVELSWLAALGQRVDIRSLNIIDPDIRISRDSNGGWIPSEIASPLVPVILQARQAIAANPASPDLSFLPNWRIGSITMKNAKIQLIDTDGSRELVSSLDLRANWPSLNEAMQIAGTGVWRGGEFTSSATLSNAVRIAAGGSGGLNVRFSSDAAVFQFDGVANLSRFFFADGDVKFETPSMGKLLSWIGAELDAGATMGQMALGAILVTKDEKMIFDRAQINFNGNPAQGVFELSVMEDLPALSGTIAFEQLDLASFLAAFAIGTNFATTQSGIRFLDQINLDLRLSAASANAGPLPLTEVGAAVRIKNGKADFDLGDAALYGGRVEANLALSQASGLPDGELSIKLTGVNLAQVPGTAALPVTNAPADGALALEGKYAGFLAFLQGAQGTASVQFGKGEVRNFDMATLVQRLDAGQIFNLPEIYRGATRLNGAGASAAIKNGVAILSEANIELSSEKLVLSGALPFLSRGLALSGELSGAESPARSFFVGGAWEQPFVTPIK